MGTDDGGDRRDGVTPLGRVGAAGSAAPLAPAATTTPTAAAAPSAAAGWFPDPAGVGQHRWWDGASWSAHTVPSAPGQPIAIDPTATHRNAAPFPSAVPATASAGTGARALQPPPRGSRPLAERTGLAALLTATVLGLGLVAVARHDPTDGVPPGPQVDSVQVLVDQVVAAGLGCHDVVVPGLLDGEDPGEAAEVAALNPGYRDEAACTIEGEEVTLSTYRDHASARRQRSLLVDLGCPMAKAFGVDGFVTATGPNWLAVAETPAVAGRLAEVLGGRAQHHRC